jgi:putative Holliday junction resolvase
MGRVLAVDLGKKRVGLALSDPLRMIAQPWRTSPFISLSSLAAEIAGIVQEKDVERVIVGLPIKENGEEGEGCRLARQFAALLEQKHIPAELWDERFTSRLAEQVLHSHGKKRKDNKDKIDRIAASFILESYLKLQK